MIQCLGKDSNASYTKYDFHRVGFFKVRELFDNYILQVLKLMCKTIWRGKLAWEVIR